MEDNIKIAQYMGYNTYESNGYIMVRYSDNNERTIQDTHYQTDWNWLTPVVKKIYSCSNKDTCISLNDDISDVYKQVVRFINNHKNT